MALSPFERMMKSSHISGSSAVYIESMYEKFLENPNAVPTEWRDYFNTLPVHASMEGDVLHSTIVSHFERLGRNRFKARPERESDSAMSEHERKQIKVMELINAYRSAGHRKAELDPLQSWDRPEVSELRLKYHNLDPADLSTVFGTGSSHFFESEHAKLSDIITALEETYCQTLAAEYTYLTEEVERTWIRHRLESVHSIPQFEADFKRTIFDRLAAAEGLEKYLHNRYPGIKRFGLEGSESLIPMLHEGLQHLGYYGVVETVIGMPHRGRLNVLVNILGKQAADLFDEFEGNVEENEYSGDVKYHQGFSSNVATSGGEMHVALSFNPSHLEIVGPVVIGSVRARQDRRKDVSGTMVAPILIHGDASFAGQGVVMETFQMSQTRGYFTGGTIHVILNNQIGFTTSNPKDTRSTEYCSEIAKMINAPVLHVNADDVEASVFAMQCAVDFRNLFGKDIVIDLVCYRRRGHNEAEDPSKTQPLMYQQIANHPTTKDLYAEQLISEGVMTLEETKLITNDIRDRLDRGETIAQALVREPDTSLFVNWRPYLGHEWTAPADTTLSRSKALELVNKLNEIPDGFVVHKQVQKILEDRQKMAVGALPINWGCAEVLAYASVLDEGHHVRLSGQDVGIGTFSHRHANLYCQRTGDQYTPLNQNIDGGIFEIYDSFLSEEAVLAFEYGYATTSPDCLTIWEAQFGDFANGAQVVIDQFVSSGESKWQRLCGLVMLLPHGYEGAGPEHSSARLERFLQLCAEKNMQVCIPTTPAQIFHLLRRQIIRPMRRPLVVMSPKSLLRHKKAISTLDELCDGHFQTLIGEVKPMNSDDVERLILCSGKVYYELVENREEHSLENIAIVRLEQLYPFPHDEFDNVLRMYKNLKRIVWCQEEPQNQGAWYSSKHHLDNSIDQIHPHLELEYAGRLPYAAPAGGMTKRHLRNQKRLVDQALGIEE
ncbi:MAG: 2-oxoglutarate dehydrogenase E1 component [Gammaproteobacteria bacterium]|nr:2-oxoglutarate dehydrogenase E1 component [Gammaproteobacteria bacterium]